MTTVPCATHCRNSGVSKRASKNLCGSSMCNIIDDDNLDQLFKAATFDQATCKEYKFKPQVKWFTFVRPFTIESPGGTSLARWRETIGKAVADPRYCSRTYMYMYFINNIDKA